MIYKGFIKILLILWVDKNLKTLEILIYVMNRKNNIVRRKTNNKNPDIQRYNNIYNLRRQHT